MMTYGKGVVNDGGFLFRMNKFGLNTFNRNVLFAQCKKCENAYIV